MLDRLVDTLLQFIELFKFWTVVPQYEQGVLLRLGKFVTVVEPGFRFVWPLGIDHVATEVVVMQTKSLGNLSTTTKDNKSVGFECIITYKINDIQKALLSVDRVDDAIVDACQGIVGMMVSSMTLAELMNAEQTTEKLSLACRKRGWRYGVEILTAQLAGVSLVRNIRLLGDYYHGKRA
jgi:regulator of protease activity HflC (stomatin/prohibitin superfamily)